MPNFSWGGYYGKVNSRARRALLVGLVVAGASALSLPFVIGQPDVLAFTYLGYILVAVFAYRWGVTPALLAGAIFVVADAMFLARHLRNGDLLQTGTGLGAAGFAGLSFGLGNAGRIARDFRQIKFSDQVPKAVDVEVFATLLDKEIGRVKRYRLPSSLAMMEFRVLARAEKECGSHQAELMLRQVQQFLVRQVRRSDTLAWLGGPYFSLLLPATNRERAEIAVDRLRESLRNIQIRSFVRLGTETADWRMAVVEIKGDEADAFTLLENAAAHLDPVAPRRLNLRRRERGLAQ